MKLIALLMQGFAGAGSHRAADQIPLLEAECNRLRALLWTNQERLAHADELITTLVASRDDAQLEARDLRAEAGRVPALLAQIQNLQAIRVPAPADCGPAIRHPEPDPDTTQELRFIRPLWDVARLKKTAA